MTKLEKIIMGAVGVLLVAVFGFILSYLATRPTEQKLGQVYGVPAFVATSTATQATTTLYTFAGVLHTVSVTKPVSNSVITIYDSATTTAPTIAPIVITIPSSTSQYPFTLTFDEIFKNGVTIQQGTATSTLTLTYQQF